MKKKDEPDIFGIPLSKCVPYLLKLGAAMGFLAAVIVCKDIMY